MQTQKHTTCKQILKNKKYAYKIIKKIKQYEAKPTPYQKGEAERLAQYIKTTDTFYPKKPIFTQSKKMGLKYFIENMDRIVDQGYISITNGKGKHIKLGIPRYFRKKLNELYPEKYELLMEKLNQSLIELHSEIKQTLITLTKQMVHNLMGGLGSDNNILRLGDYEVQLTAGIYHIYKKDQLVAEQAGKDFATDLLVNLL